MIRDANSGDFGPCMDLGERLVAKTPYRDIKLDRQSCLRTYGQCMSSALGFAKVAEHDGEVTGLLLGVAAPLWWGEARYASDLVFYAERAGDGVRLLRAFVKWARSVPKVRDISVGQSSAIHIERTGAIYRRTGFKKVGELWCMNLDQSGG